MIKTRSELIYLLTDASEIEHSLCCIYLFAAFSLKRSIDEGVTWEQLLRIQDWMQTTLLIAREEMEHLGLASNLLTSIGGSPSFHRANFPQPARYFPFDLTLEAFSEATVKRFVCFERPIHIRPEDCFCFDGPNVRVSANSGRLTPHNVPYKTIGELYMILREAFIDYPAPDSELFIGPPDAQVGGAELGLNLNRVGESGGGYDIFLFPVVDRASAVKAIDTIIEQGEGTHSDDKESHYYRFLDVLHELQAMKEKDPDFEPARKVMPNPLLDQPRDTTGGNIVTNPTTRQVLDLFNDSYALMLQILIRFYAHTNETQEELNGLRYAAFFPMMTMVIRPLSEILTTLPFGEKDDGFVAGPSFEYENDLGFLPHRQAAWQVILERMETLAIDAAAVAKLPDVPPRLAYVAQNIELVRRKFAEYLVL